MDTRPNPLDHTERKVFAEPVTTDLLRFEAWSGDGMYSVSEIQVFAPEGTVTVTVAGVEDAEGWQLAGVLYDGVGISDPDHRAIGGFAASVDTDSFSTIQLVRQPADNYEGLFPYVGEDPLVLPPGTYTLMVWLGRDLGPYSRWVPASSEGLTGCVATVEVEEGQAATVTVTGGFGDVGGGSPRCTLGAGPGDATGTIELSVRDWSGVEGYRLLAGVSCDSGLGGGAFWALIDSDPFSTPTDVAPFAIGPPIGINRSRKGANEQSVAERDNGVCLDPQVC
jgi:hypothetical protein